RDATVFGAVGRAVARGASAEAKGRVRRIADWPFAHRVLHRQHGDHVAVGQTLGLDVRFRLSEHSRGGSFTDGQRRSAARERRTGQLRRFGPRQRGRTLHWSGRSRPSGESQTVHFADDGVTGDASQPLRDLTGAVPFGPEFLQFRDTFLGPAHELISTASGNHARHNMWMCARLFPPLYARDSSRAVLSRNMQRVFSTGISIYGSYPQRPESCGRGAASCAVWLRGLNSPENVLRRAASCSGDQPVMPGSSP